MSAELPDINYDGLGFPSVDESLGVKIQFK
jgi:hypothetical protein